MRAILLGADKPLYLQAHITGGHGWSSEVSEEPLWSPGGEDRCQVPRSASSSRGTEPRYGERNDER